MSNVYNDNNRVKIVNDDGDIEYWYECEACNGLGGYDWSKDCETYDDWRDCTVCEGKGIIKGDN